MSSNWPNWTKAYGEFSKSAPLTSSSNIITIIMHYYMTSSVSGQDEPNLAPWLATRAGKIKLSCPLGIRVMSRKEHLSCYAVLSRIINRLLTKLVRSFASVHKHAKKELGQYPAILTEQAWSITHIYLISLITLSSSKNRASTWKWTKFAVSFSFLKVYSPGTTPCSKQTRGTAQIWHVSLKRHHLAYEAISWLPNEPLWSTDALLRRIVIE